MQPLRAAFGAFLLLGAILSSKASAGFSLHAAAFPAAAALVHQAHCDEDCRDYREEAEEERDSDEDAGAVRAHRPVDRAARDGGTPETGGRRTPPPSRTTRARPAPDEAPPSKPTPTRRQTQVAQSESSSIAMAPDGADGETSVAANGRDLSCKSFFPSVGMTLSVPCE